MGTWGKLALGGLAGTLIGIGASFAAARSYASQTVLSIEGPPTPQARADLIHSLGERAWTRGALAQMIDKFNLYPANSANASILSLTGQMRDQISVEPSGPSNSRFTIRFQYGDPYLAQKVVADLSHRLTEENQRGARLGIPGAFIAIVSSPTLPSSPVRSINWVLLGEGLAAGLVVGALLSFPKRQAAV